MTSLSSTRSTPRKWKTPRCLSRGCHQPQGSLSRCPKHRDKHLDALWGAKVRNGRCDALHPFPCSGHIEANHGFDRIDKGTRWDVRNGISGCHGLNTWAHYHRRQWYDQFRAIVGEKVYAELKALADANADPDYDAIHAQLGCQCEAAKEKVA